MRWRIVATLAFALWAGLAARDARADAAAEDFARTGPFLRLGAAVGFENSSQLDRANALLPVLVARVLPGGATLGEAALDVEPLLGVSIGAGYRVHPRLALEGAFDWAEGDLSLDLIVSTLLGGTQSLRLPLGTLRVWSVTGDLKGYLLTGRIQPYAVVGLGAMQWTLGERTTGIAADATSFAPRLGGGFDVYLTRAILLNLDAGYLLGTGDLDGEDAIMLRLGVGGRF